MPSLDHPNRPLYALALILLACVVLAWCTQVRASWDYDQVWEFGDGSRCDEYACYWSQSPQGPWTRSADVAVVASDGTACLFRYCGNNRWAMYFTISPLDENGEPTDPRVK